MAERFEIVEKTLLQMLENKKYTTLRDILVTMNPSDVAGIFTDLDEKQVPLMFRLLPKELPEQYPSYQCNQTSHSLNRLDTHSNELCMCYLHRCSKYAKHNQIR